MSNTVIMGIDSTGALVAVKVDSTGAIAVTGGAGGGGGVSTPIDKSGTIITGGVAQNIAAAKAGRAGYAIQNHSTGDLWVNELATAVGSQPSIRVPADGFYETPAGCCGPGAISVYGATTGAAFTAREW
jgi:hypothetical protein